MSVSVLFCYSLSMSLMALVYYLSNRQLTKCQQAEASYQDLYNNAPCGYHSIDKDGNFLAINDTELNWLGYSREQVIGKLKITDLLTPESTAIFQENFERFLKTGCVQDLELQLIRKDGTILSVLVNATAIQDAIGNVVATRTTVFDITQRKHVEQMLRKSEERFRLAVDNIPDGFVIYDEKRRLQFVNAEGLRRAGLPLEALLGSTDEDMYPPEVADNYLPTLQYAIETRTTQTTECTITLPITGTFSVVVTYVPLLDEKGELYQILGITHDITARKQAEAALAASEKRLRTIIEAEPQCVKVLALDGTIQEMNAAGLAMIEADDLQQVIGQPADVLVVPQHRHLFKALNQQASQGKPGTLEFEIVGLKGTHRWLESYAVPLPNEQNEIIGVLGITRDITAHKQAEEDLRQSEEQLRLALEATQMGTWDWNVLTNQIKWSSGHEQVFGLGVGSFDGKYETFDACLHPEDRDALNQVVNRARLEQQDFHHEYRVVWPDGSIHWVEGKGKFFYDQTGQTVRMRGTVIEISDRKRDEEQLRLLESVVLNTNDAVLITEAEPIDLPGPRIVYANDAFTRLTGYSLEEVLGQTPRLLQGAKTDHATLAQIRAALQTWQPIRIDLINYRKDGSEFWVDLSLVPVANEQGWFTHWISVQRDISDRKQTEVALQLSEERFRRAILDAPLPIILYAEDGEVLQLNSAWTELTGYTHQEIPTLADWTKKAYGDSQEFVGADIDHLYSLNRRVAQGESTVTTHDGEIRIWEFYSAPLGKLPDGRRQAISMALDITDRKLAEAELQQSEEKFRQLAENIDQVFWMSNGTRSEILYVSPAYEQIWRRRCETLYTNPQSFLDAIHPDDQQWMIANLESNGTQPFDVEYRIVQPDGCVRWIRDRGFPIQNEFGEVYRRAGIAQDITAQKHSEAVLRQVNEQLEIRVAQRTAELQQANERLQRAYQRLQFHVENTPLAFIEWNCEFRVINWSKQAENMFGWQIEEVLGNHPNNWRFVYEQDLAQVNDIMKDLANGSQPRNLSDNRNYTKNGKVIDCEWYNSALFDESGNLVSILSLVQDVTDRKRAEEALRESEERWQLAIRGSNDGIWDWNVKTDDTFFSARWKEMLGYEDHEIANHSDEWIKRIHPDDLEQVRQHYQDHLAGKTPFYRVEYRLRCKDETYKWILTKAQALWDENGNPVRLTGFHTDISDRKWAEDALRESQQQLQAILDNSPTIIYLTDTHNRMLLVNRRYENLFNVTREQIVGKTIHEIWSPEVANMFVENNRKVIKKGTPIEVEEVVPHEDELHTYITIKFALHDANGVPYAVCGISTDITDRKQVEEALRQSYDELEIRVHRRTMELFKANEELKMENAERKRVEAELKTRARQQAAVAELGQQALAGKQLDRLMNQAVVQITQILKVEYCKVLELLPDSQSLLLRAGMGWKEGLVGQATVSVGSDSQAGYTLLSSEPVVVEDLRKEVRFHGPCLLHEHRVVSGLSVIIPGQERPYGVLGAHTTRQRKFTEDDVHFLQATANVLATTINRQQAEAALRRAHNELEIRVQERTKDLAKANLELQQKIIERQQAEEERAKLIAILEATPDIVASVSVDQRAHYLNSAARKLFGLSENEDCANFTVSDVYPEWAYQLIRKEGLPAVMRDGVWVGETAFLSHDGREIPVSQLLIAHKSPEGKVKLISTVARDITQQKKIAATLLESERRWRSLLENVRLVVVGLDNHGKVEYVNPCFLDLVGYTKEEIIGKDWFETFLPSHLRHRGQNNFLELLEQEFYNIHNQSIILTKTGEEKVIAWNNTLLQDLHGYVIGTLSIGEDITERQVIERMKDEFISVVSHELRTPLTSIHGALNLLSSGLVNTDSDKGRRVIEIAAESAERLVRLVNDILELERLESGKISLSKQTCNAAELMRQATDMMQVMANRAGITLSISPQVIQLEVDPDRIIQVLTNLLGNAIKFSSQGSTVWLTVELQEAPNSGFAVHCLPNSERHRAREREFTPSSSRSYFRDKPKQIVFQIRDQGRGIPADKLESIFERFHQVDASDSRKKGGTGLGLAICRSIVQQHGGRIWVESTLGEGSSFCFTLPGSTVKDKNYDDQANLGD